MQIKRFTYLIKDNDNGIYKIGVAKDPQKRLRELQTGNPFFLKIVELYLSDNSNLIEKTLHRKHSHFKKEGEWFDLSINEEVSFKQDCEKIENDLFSLRDLKNPFV